MAGSGGVSLTFVPRLDSADVVRDVTHVSGMDLARSGAPSVTTFATGVSAQPRTGFMCAPFTPGPKSSPIFPVRFWADGEYTDVIALARLSWVMHSVCKETQEARSTGNPW